MDINLSETEVRAIIVALKHTQRFQHEDADADEDAVKTSPGTQAWLDRKFAAEELSEKLVSVLDSDEKRQTRNAAATKSAASRIDVEMLCPNDPVTW
jgi:hypothetical protein